jgi:hypothetical protein
MYVQNFILIFLNFEISFFSNIEENRCTRIPIQLGISHMVRGYKQEAHTCIIGLKITKRLWVDLKNSKFSRVLYFSLFCRESSIRRHHHINHISVAYDTCNPTRARIPYMTGLYKRPQGNRQKQAAARGRVPWVLPELFPCTSA